MRLIDADALKEKAFGRRGGLIHTADIDAMPTVEQKSGKWEILSEEWDGSGLVRCPICGMLDGGMYPFCHGCGAKLERGDDE